MTTTCSQGHQSADAEWCDVCGERIGAAPSPPTSEPPSGAPSAGVMPPAGGAPSAPCPLCAEPNPFDALFCENCGYDFVTGQAPPAPEPRSAPPLAPPGGAASQPGEGPSAGGWIAVITVDADWFALKGELAGTPCPPVSSATVALNDPELLIGRTSTSRNIHPQIAIDTDTAVSRQHARLVRSGDSWTVTDLGSINGTYVLVRDAPMNGETMPIPADTPVSLGDGDRILLGAWTVITLRTGG